MLFVGAWGLGRALTAEQTGWFQIVFFVIWLGLLFFSIYRQLYSATAIMVHGEDDIEFISILGRVRLAAREIKSIRLTRGRLPQHVVYRDGGTIYLAGAMNEFHKFLTDLKKVNPGVDLVGC